MENVRSQCRRLQDGRVVYVAEVLVVIQDNVLVVTSRYTRSVVVCRGCLNHVISTGHTSVDVGASANLEVVDKFCYLGDMLSVDGDADAAVEARIQIGRNNSGSWYHCLPIGIYQ